MITINIRDKRPIYEQIMDSIKEQIIHGLLKPNDKMPSIRQLASTLEITPNTVSKAYTELEREGVLITVRGKGNFISDTPIGDKGEKKMEELTKVLQKLCIEWQYTGQTKETLIEMIDKLYVEEEN
ncbi:MAG: hypothetical protein ATN35_11910 [Epulopiscium sp. Nele67-Bin004]|nr:MAG: hypothetical protein ATN35_11910 [Epulopiscium sp. Nele67-Bin004]